MSAHSIDPLRYLGYIIVHHNFSSPRRCLQDIQLIKFRSSPVAHKLDTAELSSIPGDRLPQYTFQLLNFFESLSTEVQTEVGK